MLIYYLIYIPFLLCAFYDFKPTPLYVKKRIIWFWSMVFTLFRGLRWEVGTDWEQFYQVYQDSSWENIFNYVRGSNMYGEKLMEWGYMLINAVFNELSLPYTVFLLFTNFLVMYCYSEFAKKNSKYPILTLICLINIGVVFPIRQNIANAIILWAFNYLINKQFKVYFIAVFLAMSIHRGAAIAIPLGFLPLIENYVAKIGWKSYLAAYISTYFISAVFGDYIMGFMSIANLAGSSTDVYIANYMNMDNSTTAGFNNSLLNGLSYTLFFVLILYIFVRYKEDFKQSIKGGPIFFLLYVTAACIDNIIRRSDSNGITEIMGRVTTIFDMYPLFFPLIFTVLLKNVRLSMIPYFIFLIYMGYKFYQQIFLGYYVDLYIPYKSVF